ncbi:MAG: hypothetical protein ACUBOA_02720 [Candidatus Loosdrechtia sp.]|uniref:hypothetical protein n=1 Tax=Candidatus Loosdrechtia sp. TaxID=3101272 RepID=UPI003A69F9A6|nr:MAG: hypothetical protein QY305_02105 [Candidatus Jettenia sp. AMX2]
MNSTNSLWRSRSESEWHYALDKYHKYIKSSTVARLDAELDPLDLSMICNFTPKEWYFFLYDKYFPWKYTAPNRLATTRNSLKKNSLTDLYQIKERLLSFDKNDIRKGLELAKSIKGLGIAGASGLLALMYPEHFGTVDEFLILALANVNGLSELLQLQELAKRINGSKKPHGKSFNISHKNGTMLINIMRRKAAENNEWFRTSFWTPRKIDKVLWAYGHL